MDAPFPPLRPDDRASHGCCADLLAKRYGELHRFALNHTRCPDLADEVMQEAWLRLATTDARTLACGAPVRHPMAYIRQVIAHLCIDCGRRQQRWRHRHGEACLAEHLAWQGPTPCQVAAAQQEYAQLLQAIRDLPPRCRQVFLLYRARQLSMRDIAALLGLAPKTVEHHIARAVLSCRRHMPCMAQWPARGLDHKPSETTRPRTASGPSYGSDA